MAQARKMASSHLDATVVGVCHDDDILVELFDVPKLGRGRRGREGRVRHAVAVLASHVVNDSKWLT